MLAQSYRAKITYLPDASRASSFTAKHVCKVNCELCSNAGTACPAHTNVFVPGDAFEGLPGAHPAPTCLTCLDGYRPYPLCASCLCRRPAVSNAWTHSARCSHSARVRLPPGLVEASTERHLHASTGAVARADVVMKALLSGQPKPCRLHMMLCCHGVQTTGG